MRYFVLIPAALLVIGILVAQGQSERRSLPSSAQGSEQAAANGSPAVTASVSQAAPASSVTAEARVIDEVDSGGDGGALPATATPASTAAGEAQSDEHPPSKREDAGSSPAASATEVTAALVTETATKAPSPALYQGDLMSVIQATFPESEWATAYRVAMCESGGNPDAVEPGHQHFGGWQVDPSIWGPVPADLYSQAVQAAGIVAEAGWSQWSCQ